MDFSESHETPLIESRDSIHISAQQLFGYRTCGLVMPRQLDPRTAFAAPIRLHKLKAENYRGKAVIYGGIRLLARPHRPGTVH
jgi:hypothetical protein